jgi:hypothetical protein
MLHRKRPVGPAANRGRPYLLKGTFHASRVRNVPFSRYGATRG